jgi:hypothetical protein
MAKISADISAKNCASKNVFEIIINKFHISAIIQINMFTARLHLNSSKKVSQLATLSVESYSYRSKHDNKLIMS